jgi:hypothetical protein
MATGKKCRDPFRRRKTKTKNASPKARPPQGERWRKGACRVQSHSRKKERGARRGPQTPRPAMTEPKGVGQMADEGKPPPGGQIVTTIPDPTTLTNQLVERAVSAAREIIETRFEGNHALYDERFRSFAERLEINDKQTSKVAGDVKSAVDAAFAAVTAGATQQSQAYDERFRAIAERFELLDKQTIKAASDVKSAVDAAFAAAASGVSQQNQANFLASQKQEAAFTKLIDQLAASVAQTSKANDDKLNDLKKINDDKFGDLKDRIVAMEGRSSVSDPTTAATLRDMASVISSLKASNDQNLGGRQQKADITTWIFSAIAAASAFAFLVIDIFKPSH